MKTIKNNDLDREKFTEKRVQCVKGSYYMYLPKNLCEKYEIDHSKIVYMKQFADDSLLLHFKPQSRVKPEPFVINMNIPQDESNREAKSSHSPSFEYLLNQYLTAYIIGHGNIVFRNASKIPLTYRNRINAMTKRFYGMVVVSETAAEIIVEEHLGNIDINVFWMQLLSKINLMMTNFIEIVVSYGSMKKDDELLELLDELITQDDQIDEHRYTVEHICHKALKAPQITHTSCVKYLHYSEMTRFIERIGDYLVKMSILLKSRVITEPAFILEQLNIMLTTYTSIRDFADRNDTVNLWEFIQKIDVYAVEMKQHINDKHPDTDFLVPIRRICNICGDIAEIRINDILSQQA